MKINLTKNELDEMQDKLLQKLEFAKQVQASTKDLTMQLELIYLAKIGYSAMLD